MIVFLMTLGWSSPGDMFLRYNIPQLAREHAKKRLRKNPDDPNAHAQMAISLCRLGHYNDALPYFSFAQENMSYKVRIHEYHADALRYTGNGQGAVTLREELLMDNTIPTGMHPRILAGMVNDWRAVGEIEKAFDVGFRLMSKHPNAALSYATLAQLYLDIHEPDEAFFYIWRGRKKVQNTRTEEVYARYLLEAGYPELAEQHIKSFFENHVRNSLLTLYAQTKLHAYGPKKALALLERNKFKSNRSPGVLWVRFQAYKQLGKKKEASDINDVLQNTYPYWTKKVRMQMVEP